MNRKAITAICALLAVFAISALAQAQSSTGQQAGLTNPGFEEPRVKEVFFELKETMPGWKTTDTHFEIWSTGFKEVASHEGSQFVELNAYIDGTLFQDSTGIQPGSVLEFTFAHRGRSGDDTMKLTITDLGADNALEGGDDTVLFTNQYTTGKDAWAVYDSTTEPKIKAIGNTVRFAYGAISTATGELGEGNFLDAANFGIGVVSARRDRVAAASTPKSSGTVVVWGRNEKGQTEVPAGLTDVTAISAGTAHCMALKGDGTVVAWGSNTSQQADVPAGLSDVMAIASGASHNLALKQDGTVVAWGSNTSQQADVPAGLSDVMAIAAGGEISLALKNDGTVVKWGGKDHITQLGELVDRLAVPQGLSDVTAISAEGQHCMALKRDGTVVTWGNNEHGQSDVPEGLNGVVAIEVTYFDCLALKKDGTVVAWGGLYDDGKLQIPEGLSDVAAISGGSFHTMALKRDGAIGVWGSVYPEREHGQSVVPSGLSGVTRIAAGDDFSMALVSGQQTDTTQLLTTTKSGSKKVPAGTTNSIGMEFKLIPAGTFMMGSPESEVGRDDDEQQHEVTITRDYFIGVTEVTQSQWQQVMGTTPWKGHANVAEGEDYPASCISWDEAEEFCRKLSAQEGRTYRLPTEAEWEFACRGGTTTAYSFGDDASQLEQYAWFDNQTNYATQVKQKSPNGFGLYDMHGNISEWCADWISAYPKEAVTDPVGPAEGSERVVRGGGFNVDAEICRAAHRSWFAPSSTSSSWGGFRVLMAPGSDSGQLAMNETPPKNAMTLDIDSGPFTFGYSTAKDPTFQKFTVTDYPFAKDPNIKRLNRKEGDWFSFVQNTGDAASDPANTATVHYPPKAEGSGVLHPGQDPGDVAKARFTAESDGEHHFEITTTVIAESPTGVGVTIYAGEQVVAQKYMQEHNVPWTNRFRRTLTKGQTVDIAVDNGTEGDWSLDHVLVTANAWTVSSGTPSATAPQPTIATNSIGMDFKLIAAGTFMMGSPENEEGRLAAEQQHEVTITRDYYIGITEVTQSQWQQVMGTSPWKGQKQVIEGNDIAASYISWDDAGEFCRKLSEQEGRTYRLPTEAEWEYACRGGTTTAYSFGDDVSQLEQYAWHHGSEPNYASQVKQKSPNGFGLYDMHGNLLEFCQDWYGDYPQGSVADPPGPYSGTNRVCRGGCFLYEAPFVRSASRRFIIDSAKPFPTFGLRVVLVPGSDSGQLALNRAKDLLRGHWIPNLDETSKRVGELEASEREVLSILSVEFTSRSISLLVQDEPVSLSINTELVTPNEFYDLKQTEAGDTFQLVLKDEEGVEHLDGVQFLSETQILVTLGKGGRPVVLDWSSGAAEDTSGVAADTSHSTVVAWGNNDKGQTNVPEGLSDIIAIAAGGEHSMALKADGTVVAWGNNGSKQTDIPEGLSGVISIAAGGNHSLALKQDGTVVAWGFDFFGQTRVPEGLSGVTAIAAGDRFSMALKADGTVVAWGEIENYNLTPPEGLSGVTAIAAGGYHSLALKQDGTVVAWGTCLYGYYKRDVPHGLSDVTAMAAAWSDHDVVLKQDGTIVGWATPDSPNDPPDVFGEPKFPAGLSRITAIDAGEKCDLALKQDGTVVAWGSNAHGVTDIPEGLSDVTAIAAGRKHALALVRKGKAH